MKLSSVAVAVAASAAMAAAQDHPVPEDPRWLVYHGAGTGAGTGAGADDAVGRGAHVVFVAGEQEYRAEQALPMLARLLSERHGFDCTVLFAQHDGLVDPSQKTRPDDPEVEHDVPGLEYLATADLVVWFTRFLTLPEEQLAQVYRYLDSGKPLIAIRTANHGFRDRWNYVVDGKRVRFGEDVLGGTFRGHHGGWHHEATRGLVVDAQRSHPILRGVDDVFGPSDVYRTYAGDDGLPEGCTALLLGQPLKGRSHDDEPNTDKQALPIAWIKTWTGNGGEPARIFHTTMGSARDFESAGLRRLFLNAALWCLGREDRIRPDLSVELVGDYVPLASGFDHEKLGVRPRPPADYR
ncbi:MAG: ThuA domain-containing protein [Planctomycetes bacterium]|nr:ThuA domain-containing protein [Planctomycetota bacterium]